MEFDIDLARCILARTPDTLQTWLGGLPEPWVFQNEGPDTWSAFDIVGHLVHGERTDWVPRVRMILEHGVSKSFVPFDRFAQLETSDSETLSVRLDTFAELRGANLIALDEFDLDSEQLTLQGRHPEFGLVTMRQLLAAWVVHDLDHLAQVARVMARCYSSAVGPWAAYLPVLGG
jgi:hypothetical protein